jgi:hypothetical protein
MQEKERMLREIARTDFSIIEQILRETITSNPIEKARVMLQSCLRSLAIPRDEDYEQSMSVEDTQEQLEGLNSMDVTQHGTDSLINKLRAKHTNLATLYNNISQAQNRLRS